MFFVKSKEKNAKFFTDLIKQQYQIKNQNTNNKYVTAEFVRIQLAPGESNFTRANWALESSHS